MWRIPAEGGEEGGALAQAQVLLRASDPVYELAIALGGHRQEDRFWEQTLVALATHLGVVEPTVRKSRSCVDPEHQWRHWRNLWHNPAVTSVLQTVTKQAR